MFYWLCQQSLKFHFPRHTWKIVDSTNYLCNCVNKANIKDVICEILEWGSRMWLRLKIIYLIISLSLSHPLSNLATTYYMCPDANFAIDRIGFRGFILRFVDVRFIDRSHSCFSLACSLMKKIINQSFIPWKIHVNPTIRFRYLA